MALSEEMMAALNAVKKRGWSEADVVTLLRAVRQSGIPISTVTAAFRSAVAGVSPPRPRSER
jgi:hypothetical protein